MRYFTTCFSVIRAAKKQKRGPNARKIPPPLWFAGHKNIDAPRFKNFKASDKTIVIPVRLCLLPTAAPRPAALQGGSRWSDKAPMDELQVTYAPAYLYSNAQDSLRNIDGVVLHGQGRKFYSGEQDR